MELDLDAAVAPRRGSRARPVGGRPTRWPRRTSRSWCRPTSPPAEVEAALRDGAGALLESVRLFDVYTGSQVREGHKSLAFALRFRAPDRTLTVEESSAARDAAVGGRRRAAAAPSSGT